MRRKERKGKKKVPTRTRTLEGHSKVLNFAGGEPPTRVHIKPSHSGTPTLLIAASGTPLISKEFIQQVTICF